MSKLLPAMLFVPGGDDRKLARLPQLRAPAFILDLEDAVAITAKEHARRAVAEAVNEWGESAQLYVRVNSADPDLLHADLASVVRPGLTGVVLPKVDSARDVEITDWAISSLEQRAGLAPGHVLIMPTIETVAGLDQVRSIAAASRRVRCMVFGAGDFSRDLGLDWPAPDGTVSPVLISAKCQLVLASRLAGLQPPHDGVYPLFRDGAGLVREARQAYSLGMFGKHAIHPDQVEPITTVFMPSPAQISRARTVLTAFSASESHGVANLDVEGMFVDYPVAARARQVLDLADELGVEVPNP